MNVDVVTHVADAVQIRTWIGKLDRTPTAVQDLPPTARKAQADVRSSHPVFSDILFVVCCSAWLIALCLVDLLLLKVS